MKTKTTLRPTYDALIVGARCAGAATAMLLAQRGLRVLAIDRAPYGSDTVSTHALARAGVMQLHRWGLLEALEAAGTPKIRSTTFHYGSTSVPVAIEPRDGIDALYAPRRTVLDALLVDAAREAGAEVEHGVAVDALIRDAGGRVRGVRTRSARGRATAVHASVVIGADGLRSTVARLAGASAYRTGQHASALVYGHFEGLDVEGYHFFYELGASAGAIPTNDGLTCVFAALPAARLQDEAREGVGPLFERVLAEAAPALARELRGATRIGALRGFPGHPGLFRHAHGPGWALVGDAAYFRDPLTAHGMTDALRDAELLAAAVAVDTEAAYAAYQSTRDAVSNDFHDVTDAIASFDWDLDGVARQHRALSRATRAEVALVGALEPASSADRMAS